MVNSNPRSRVPGAVWIISIGVHVLIAAALIWAIRSNIVYTPSGDDPSMLSNGEVRIEFYPTEMPREVTVPIRVIEPSDAPILEQAKPIAPVQPMTQNTSQAMGVGTNPNGTNPNRLSSGTQPGKRTPILHQSPKPGQKIVYVIDGSASMGVSGRFEHATASLLQTLRGIGPEVKFQVVVYQGTARLLTLLGSNEFVPISPQSITEVAMRLQTWQPEGGSSHLAGMQLALRLEPDAIFLMSDAEDLSSQQLATISQLNRHRAVIHTVLIAHSSIIPDRNSPLAIL